MAVITDTVTSTRAREAYERAGWWDGQTLRGRVERWASERPDDIAVVDDEGRRRSFAELDRDATAFAAQLEALGVGPGHVVSVQLPNVYEAAVAAVGVMKDSAVINTLLPGYRQRELVHVWRTAEPTVVVTPVSYRGFEYAPLVSSVSEQTGHAVHHVTEVPVGVEAPAGFHPPPPAPAADVSELIFTSGTESAPKAVMHTEQNSNFSVRIAASDLGLTPTDVVWMPSPVGHSTGFNYGLRMALYHGLRLVLQDRWDPARAADLIHQEGCSYTLAATTFLKDLVDQGIRLPSLRLFGCGGAPVPPDLVDRASALGITVLRLYGSTEVLVATWNRPTDPPDHRRNSDGRPMSHVEVEIRDDGGRPCPAGRAGEIFTRGPNTSVGFFRDVDRTAATYEDGWVRSGDLAVMDEGGWLTVTGRKKEIIIRGGMNITPREVEDLLVGFDEIDRAAVVGLPDERLGEQACACVVLAPGATLGLDDMVRRLQALGLATFKLPERLVVMPNLPMTASGKVQKHEIVRTILGEGRS